MRSLTAMALALLIAPSVHADQLDCYSDLASGRRTTKLGKLEGKNLKLVHCTEAAPGPRELGRAYLQWGKRTQELSAIGGCGNQSIHARLAGGEVLITWRTCQTRSYHPPASWIVLLARWNHKRRRFDVRQLYPPATKGGRAAGANRSR